MMAFQLFAEHRVGGEQLFFVFDEPKGIRRLDDLHFTGDSMGCCGK